MHETIHYHDRPSWLSFLGLLIIAAVFFFLSINTKLAEGGILLSIIFLLFAAYGRYSKEYTITEIRVISRSGLIANNSNEMELRHIRGMNVRQNAFERILNVGTLEIISAADGGAEVVFHGISNPVSVKEQVRTIKGLP